MTAPERRAWERARFLARLGSMTREEVLALDTAVGELLADGADVKRLTRGFWFAWYAGPHLGDTETDDLGLLFADIVVAMAGGVAGVDPRTIAEPRQGSGGAFLDALFPRRAALELEGVAIRLVESAVAPLDPKRAIVAAWNAGCAIALRGRLAPEVEATLTAAWRRALGDLPA